MAQYSQYNGNVTDDFMSAFTFLAASLLPGPHACSTTLLVLACFCLACQLLVSWPSKDAVENGTSSFIAKSILHLQLILSAALSIGVFLFVWH